MHSVSNSFSRLVKTLSCIATFLVVFATAIPAFATDVDATHEVTVMKTEHKWFYWPGWAFAGLTFLVIALMAFAYWKSVAGPKYRGRKVTQ